MTTRRPTPQEQGLLDDVVEHPDDDGPRLIYADWLDDHGDHDRAEFIRVQLELERPDLDTARRGELAGRECALLHQHEGEWLEPLPDLTGVTWHFRRGFACAAVDTF